MSLVCILPGGCKSPQPLFKKEGLIEPPSFKGRGQTCKAPTLKGFIGVKRLRGLLVISY